jgi:hypothetical protein
MSYVITSRFERGKRSAIFKVGGIRAGFVFIESRQRVFRLPLQKNGTDLVALDLAKDCLSRCAISATGSDLPLDKHGIELVEVVPILSCNLHGSLGILARIRQIVCLQRKSR